MNGKIQKRWLQGLLSAVLLGLNIPSSTLAQTYDAPPPGSVTIESIQTADAPPPGSVTIETVSAGGSGCPAGSTRASISSDRTQAQLFFDKFIAELDVNPTQFPSTTDCTVSYNIKYPAGWSVSLEKVQIRGSVDTSYGATGTLSSLFYIPGLNVDTYVTKNFPANQQGFFLVEQAAPVLAYTRCGAVLPLNVTTELSLSGTPTGYNTIKVVDSPLLRLAWRRC
ncbi:MAG: DUF4360 domain-containing protein [Stigonema ocellatum SAG 48.90 = DSM 106950]|nr:DUF4360 domain-containing protein [Stigonema ocellatum SAG 48.90 = DSM 106950]